MMLFSIIVFGYLSLRLVFPLRCRIFWKILFEFIVFCGAFKFHILYVLGGPMFFSPDLPYSILFLTAWLFAFIFILFFCVLICDSLYDVYRFLKFLVHKNHMQSIKKFVGVVLNPMKYSYRLFFYPAQQTIHKKLEYIHIALVCFACIGATWGIFQGTTIPTIRQEVIELPNIAPETENFTIALLADLHADRLSSPQRIETIVQMTNDLHADIICIVGDFVDGKVITRQPQLLPLKKLNATYGVFGVPGNHEYYSGYKEWMKFLPTLGINMLVNESHMIQEKNIAIIGVPDSSARIFKETLMDIPKALKNVPENATKILLVHRPKVALEASSFPFDLQLSGHTHGGMIVGMDYFVSLFNGGFVHGLYKVKNLLLYVSRGTCMWHGFPIRLGIPAEITLLTFKKSNP